MAGVVEMMFKIRFTSVKLSALYMHSYSLWNIFPLHKNELIARDITNICWGAGLGSLSKLVTHDSFVMQVTSRRETLL